MIPLDPATLLTSAIENAPDCAFIVLDAYGVVQHWNRGAGILFGQPASGVVGAHFSTIFTIEDVRAGVPEQQLLEASRDDTAEDARWHVRSDGTRFFADSFIKALRDESGDLIAYVKLARDVTARRRVADERERQLVREQQLNRDKDTFFAAVSHELRTPLTALTAWIALLERGAAEPEVVQQGLAHMRQSAELLTKLVDDLLDAVRARAPKMEIARRRIELGHVTGAAVQAFRQQFEEKNLTVGSRLAEGLAVSGDPARLHQVVWNILTNAIRHTPPGGTIDVAVFPDDDHGVIEVRDNGDGIDPSFLPYIFEPFRQHRQHSAGGIGLGLGLAIARSLVEAHGGTISAESGGAGQGSTFRVRLPLAQTA